MLGLGKSNNTDFVDFADLDFGGRALRANDDDETLKFGDKGQFIAGKNDVLGEGAFGKVYKAMDTTTGREVAVKTELRQFGSPTLPTEARNYERIGPFRESLFSHHYLLRFPNVIFNAYFFSFRQAESPKSISLVNQWISNRMYW